MICGLDYGHWDAGKKREELCDQPLSFLLFFLRFPETGTAIAFECQGMFEQAQESYEEGMNKARELHNIGPAPPSVVPEYKLWEEHWCR